MKDSHDTLTIDAFPISRPRGRPVTSTIAQRKAKSARRSARYRNKKKILKDVVWLLANIPSIKHDIYMTFLDYLTGRGADLMCSCTLYPVGEGEIIKKIRFSELVPIYSTYEQVFILSLEN